MKKLIALALVGLICLFSGIVVGAAGADDGRIVVITKENVRYLGVYQNEWRIKFTSANGNGKSFYRYQDISLNEDSVMDICDLVRMKKILESSEDADINCDGKTDEKDMSILRSALLGTSDFNE